jgi:hypothetical protein
MLLTSEYIGVIVDALEQYGRRSLIRISGIPEPTEEGDTTEKVRKIISDIDPRYEITNIIAGSLQTCLWC